MVSSDTDKMATQQTFNMSTTQMRVTLEPLVAAEGRVSARIETNPSAHLSSLVSAYCAQTGLKFEGSYCLYDERKRQLPLYSTIGSLGIDDGQTLYIGEEGSSLSVFKQWPMIIAIAAILIGLIGIIVLSLVYGLKGGEFFDDYGVVMDAGSSKTNTIVYKWRSGKYRGTGKVFQEDNCFAKGGIAKMDPMHLEPVINCAKNVTAVISEERRPKTPLFLAATAGMRLLMLTNATRAEAILGQLRRQLPETGLDLKAVEIITGTQEGIYGWTTVNFLLNTLEPSQFLKSWNPNTFGALDMGGASMQIAFALQESMDSEDVMTVKLYGENYHVYSQSNLCFGRDEAQNRYRALLLLENRDLSSNVEDPCAPLGFSEKFSKKDIFSPICATPKDSSKIPDRNYTFVGGSDPETCRKRVSQLLDKDLCKKYEFVECFKDPIDIPPQKKFKAFATFYYTTNFLNATKASLKEYKDLADSYCRKNIDEVKKIINNAYGPQYCFNGQYIHTILVGGYHLNDETWKNVEFVSKLPDTEVGWTVGYMINATNMIPEKQTPRLISATALGIFLALFIIIILVTAIFLLLTFKRNSCKKDSSTL